MTAKSYWIGALVLAHAVALHGQVEGGTSTVSGSVWDPVVKRYIVGAVVQAVFVGTPGARRDSNAISRAFTAVSDSVGHYRLGSLPAGQFAIGFQHNDLSIYGIEPPIVAVELGGNTSVKVNLSFPAESQMVEQACAPVDAEKGGMLVGVIGWPRGQPITSALITLQWTELAIREHRLAEVLVSKEARVTEDGIYRVCGTPDGSAVLHVSGAGVRALSTDIALSAEGVTRRDLMLISSGANEGEAVIHAFVRDDGGQPISHGDGLVSEMNRSGRIVDGHLAIGGMPAGSWVVKLRALGFGERTVLLDANDAIDGRESDTVTFARPTQVLDELTVRAPSASHDATVLREIDERLRVAAGTLIRQDSPFLKSADRPSDALRAARGFVYKSPVDVEGRPYAQGFIQKPCKSAASDVSLRGSISKEVAVYLDGMRVPGGFEAINNMVLPKDILAIEAYPDVISAPPRWRTNDACAVVAVWTKK